MAKTATLYARIEPDVKEQAESILAELGIPVSVLINSLYKQIILQHGIPFEMKIPRDIRRPVNMYELTKEELDAELEKGWQDHLAGRGRPAEEVFADLRREFGI